MLYKSCLVALIIPHTAVLCSARLQHPQAQEVRSSERREHHKSPGHQRIRRDKDEKFHDFVTRPDIDAPRWDIQIYDKDALSPGYWFVAPYADLDQKTFPKWNGALIYDSSGELVWSGAPMLKHWNAFDFRVVRFEGEDMLSLIFPHKKNGEGVILSNNYEIYKSMDLRGDLKQSNMHDFTIVDNGANALTLSNDPGPATVEQSKVVGFDGKCKAAWEGFKELRVRDNEVLLDWSARDWIGLDESTFVPNPPKEQCKTRWDILHLNSIDKFPDGDYLISSRHMDALYKVSHEDGHIVWRLGGKKSNFGLKGETVFSRQHHARVHGQNETHTMVSLFDNAHGDGPARAEKPSNTISRGLLLALRTDTKPMTVKLDAHYDHPREGITNSRGSMQFLPNGNVFMGWTYSSRQSEHTSDGTLLMEAHFFLDEAHSYRNYKYPWVGRPTKPPDVHSTASNNADDTSVSTMVHVSWNGATEVKTWRLYNSTVDGSLTTPVASNLKQGFESAISLNGYAAFIVMEALDKDGNPIPHGRSDVVKTMPPDYIDNEDVAADMQRPQNPSEGSLEGLPAIFGNPSAMFILGFACAVVACCSMFWFTKTSQSSWWKRVSLGYSPLARSGLHDGHESADELELNSIDRELLGEEVDALLQPSLERKNNGETET